MEPLNQLNPSEISPLILLQLQIKKNKFGPHKCSLPNMLNIIVKQI